uniref:Uncharacterized protein n=1 Tax=Rhizophora mucronata TaxID=61149 RepID=A0A2P2JGU4_RHIMU
MLLLNKRSGAEINKRQLLRSVKGSVDKAKTRISVKIANDSLNFFF